MYSELWLLDNAVTPEDVRYMTMRQLRETIDERRHEPRNQKGKRNK